MQIKNKFVSRFDAANFKVGIVVSRFNEPITKKLLESALKELELNNVIEKNIQVRSVAGAVEIPFALQALAREKKFNCLVALGCVIRGATPHFDYVCKMAQEGVLRVSLDHHLPIGFGIITVNNEAQARARYHVGGEAVAAALELARY